MDTILHWRKFGICTKILHCSQEKHHQGSSERWGRWSGASQIIQDFVVAFFLFFLLELCFDNVLCAKWQQSCDHHVTYLATHSQCHYLHGPPPLELPPLTKTTVNKGLYRRQLVGVCLIEGIT